MALLTTAQAKARIPQLAGTSQDDLIDDLIARADGLMALYCGYPLQSGSVLPTMVSGAYLMRLPASPHGAYEVQGDALHLPVRPVVSLTSVYQDVMWGFGASTQVANADLEVDAERGVLWRSPSGAFAGWSTSPRSIKVTAVCGYATPLSDSHPLVEICAAVVRHLLARPTMEGRQTATTSGQSVQHADLDDLLPLAVRRALAPYRLGGGLAG